VLTYTRKPMNKQLLLLVISLGTFTQLFGQKTVNHHAEFGSGQQNMWGPSFQAITLDQTIELFNFPWNLSFNTGNSGIVTVAGFSFGGALSGGFSGSIGSTIEIKGFTTGTVEVDYPVNIELTMDQDEEYDPGDMVSIATNYEVEPGYELATSYPSAGEFFWDLNFQFAASASATLCAFGCLTIPIIPSFNTGLQSLNLVTISGSGASTENNTTGIWYLGPANYWAADQPVADPNGIWPYAKPPATQAQLDNPLGAGWTPTQYVPWHVHVGVFPIEIPGAFGLSGEVTIPYVITDDYLNGTDNSLGACGDSTYFTVELEIFKLLGEALGMVNEPTVQAIGEVLSNLSGEDNFGVAEVSWNFFSAGFEMNITNKQCFQFNPTIFGRFDFPIPVSYQVTHNGVTSPITTGSIINFEVGDSISYKFPCYFDSLSITPTYSIDGQFRNHTYDSVSFDFNMSAFAFGINIPTITVIPGFTIPSVCFSLPYPCPTWSNPFKICWTNVCTPTIVVPPIQFPGFSFSFGPLLDESFSLANFKYNWLDITWALEGFQDTTFVPFYMKPYKMGISNTPQHIACYGGNDGAIDVTIDAYNHAYPYAFTWTNGITSTVNSPTATHDNLSAGAHVLTVYDNNGCQLVTGATLTEPLPLHLSFTKIDKSCGGGVNDGSITLNVSGGTAPYNYNWSNGTVGIGLNTINNLAAGTYTVTVTDANNCVESTTVVITEPLPLGHSAVTTDILCHGQATGGVSIVAFGGSLPYSYSWNNSATTPAITNVPAGNYTITITDDKGCVSTGNYQVNQPAAPLDLSLIATNINCHAGNDGEIQALISGGTAPYNFQWSGNFIQLPFTTPTISNLVAGTYTLTVTDANGCSISASQTITQPAAPIAQNPIVDDILCFGDFTGNIFTNISGGTPGYTYLWNNTATGADLTGVTAGNYEVIVTDANGCQATYAYQINQPANALSLDLIVTDVKCFDGNDGIILANVNGGTSPYTYSWSNGGTTHSISNLTAGSYNLDVTDANGCVISAGETINQPAASLSYTFAITDVACFGDNSGSIDLSVTGGTSPYAYQWTNLSSFILSDTTQDISNQLAGSYSVVITDANGCQESGTATINQPTAPLSVSGVTTPVDCFGVNSGSIAISVTGGTTGYSYNWSDGSTNQNLTAAFAGTYTLVVTDANGCAHESTYTISEPQAPLSVVLTGQDVKCFGASTGNAQSFVGGGTAPYSYAWSNGSTTHELINIPAGVYTLTVTDANGCTAFSGTTINQPDELVFLPTITDVSCYGYSDGEIVIDIAGGVQPYYFTWGNQNNIVLNNPSETLSNLIASDYLIRVKDANNCVTEQVLTVNQPPVYEAELTITNTSCFEGADGSIEMSLIGGTTPYSTEWSNGEFTENIFGLTAGVYSYTTTDAQGCEIRGEGEVNQPTEIKITYQIIPVTCIDQSDASIEASAFGGTPPFQYLWSTGEQGSMIEELEPGIYELTVFDDNNCENTFSFDVTEAFNECLVIPNTFTPNGDNYNDTWVLGNINLYPSATVKVFNKWGNEIFSNNDGTYDPWDGSHNGQPLPSGVYYYIIILNNEQNNQYTGTVTIVR
jgi:gliding motility-associated-like protein